MRLPADFQHRPVVPDGAMHVAVAVIRDRQGRVLITRRPAHAHQGGLWEFPGGKVEAAEGIQEALRRELLEEIGIHVLAARPLIGIEHRYRDRHVYLDVWEVTQRRGRAAAREGQPLRWVEPGRLRDYAFPAANRPIVTAAGLPGLYAVTPEPDEGEFENWYARIERAARAGLRLLQCRAKHLSAPQYIQAAARVLELCRPHGCQVLLNSEPALAAELGASGVHLSSDRLLRLERRPMAADYRVAASCHNAHELEHAFRVGVDFAVLGPVCPTRSHPGDDALGWPGFASLAGSARLPVFAIGGMLPRDFAAARYAGAQGVAMIRGLWSAPDPADVIGAVSA